MADMKRKDWNKSKDENKIEIIVDLVYEQKSILNYVHKHENDIMGIKAVPKKMEIKDYKLMRT